MPIRITGMNSGLDTENIISELVKAKSAKKDKLVKAQTKLQWKQDAWKELNTKVYNLYSKTLSNMRFQSDYLKKTTKVSNPNAASVITGANAVNGVQTLKINRLAKTGYMTGAKLETTDHKAVTGETTLEQLGITAEGSFSLKVEGKDPVEVTFDKTTTVNEVLTQLKEANVNVSFDEKNGRFFISAKAAGAGNDFKFESSTDAGSKAIEALGLNVVSMTEQEREAATALCTIQNGRYVAKDNTEEALAAAKKLNSATKIDGSDAEIELNGAVFTSNTNSFEINGLTINANAETTEAITITTEDDTEGIYDMIKNFFKEYNSLINEMDSLYNAESTKGYEPLTDEEKDAMSEKEIEKWEEKIKKSILRRDSTLSNVVNTLKSVMMQGATPVDENGNPLKYGHMYLSDFGISTLDYFSAKDNEKGAYHIDGDPDDASTSGKGDKLKTAIANDPDKVVAFFTQLSKDLYTKLGDLMKKTDYSSSFTLYDDVAMKEEYNDYTSQIKSQEQKITDFEDRYYKKFSAMETALSKLNSKQSAISGFFGM